MVDRFSSKGVAAVRFVAQRGLLKPVVRSTVKVSVHGQDHLTHLRPPFIVVANHASHLDAPLILGWLPRKHSRYLAAGAAADYFFDVWWRKALTTLFFSAFAVERNGERKRGGTSRKLLERGVPLLIFPEGGRTKSGAIRPFKKGAAALAIATEVPCVPVALVGTATAMPSGVSWPKRGRPPVDVVFGAPMLPQPDETPAEFSARLADEIHRLHASVPSGALVHVQKGTR
jgi:1-acyl-sn-glycerol-3-phosphate acyltransferase